MLVTTIAHIELSKTKIPQFVRIQKRSPSKSRRRQSIFSSSLVKQSSTFRSSSISRESSSVNAQKQNSSPEPNYSKKEESEFDTEEALSELHEEFRKFAESIVEQAATIMMDYQGLGTQVRYKGERKKKSDILLLYPLQSHLKFH